MPERRKRNGGTGSRDTASPTGRGDRRESETKRGTKNVTEASLRGGL